MSPSETVPPLPPWLDAMLPFARHQLDIEDGRGARQQVHVIDHGARDAPVVVMIHGNPTWSFLWRKVIRALPHLRCVAPDLIGLGLSSKPRDPSWHTVNQHADVLVQVLQALEVRRCVLAAQDWGGPFALALAARWSGTVEGVVFGNTAITPLTRKSSTAFHRFARTPVLSDLVFRGMSFPQTMMHRAQGDPSSIMGDVARAYRHPLFKRGDRVAPLAMARLVPDGPAHPTTATLLPGYEWARAFQGPAALIWGMRDPILGRALRKTAAVFSQVDVVETQAGHFLQEEVPEVFAEAITRLASRDG
jgi:cis-3-alkyl-4-acyloxetan-2-one decarboxylase